MHFTYRRLDGAPIVGADADAGQGMAGIEGRVQARCLKFGAQSDVAVSQGNELLLPRNRSRKRKYRGVGEFEKGAQEDQAILQGH